MDWLSFIRGQIRAQTYEISLHADDERLAEHLTVVEIETALMSGEILEEYPEDPRGPSCLALGFTHEGRPVHVVCGRNSLGRLVWITVYVPTMPKWRDARTRNR
jgi:hypothetical protein